MGVIDSDNSCWVCFLHFRCIVIVGAIFLLIPGIFFMYGYIGSTGVESNFIGFIFIGATVTLVFSGLFCCWVAVKRGDPPIPPKKMNIRVAAASGNTYSSSKTTRTTRSTTMNTTIIIRNETSSSAPSNQPPPGPPPMQMYPPPPPGYPPPGAMYPPPPNMAYPPP